MLEILNKLCPTNKEFQKNLNGRAAGGVFWKEKDLIGGGWQEEKKEKH